MTMVVGAEVTPVKHWGYFSGMVGMTIATGSILGEMIQIIWLLFT